MNTCSKSLLEQEILAVNPGRISDAEIAAAGQLGAVVVTPLVPVTEKVLVVPLKVCVVIKALLGPCGMGVPSPARERYPLRRNYYARPKLSLLSHVIARQ